MSSMRTVSQVPATPEEITTWHLQHVEFHSSVAHTERHFGGLCAECWDVWPCMTIRLIWAWDAQREILEAIAIGSVPAARIAQTYLEGTGEESQP